MINFLTYLKKWCPVKSLKLGKERDVMILDLGENRTAAEAVLR